MASVTFKRGTKAEIESTQIQDGQLLMETDQLNNNKIYLDLPNGTRVPVGGSGAWVGTNEEFKLADEEGKIADGTQVIITDDYESGITASMTLYSNSQSGLVATNVQSAIDELDSNLTRKPNYANGFDLGATSYTATQDCYICVGCRHSETTAFVNIYINGVFAWSNYLFSNGDTIGFSQYLYIPKGSTISYAVTPIGSGAIYQSLFHIVPAV